MKNLLLFLMFIFLALRLDAQYYSIGEDPATFKWRQINTDHFQVVYPSSFEAEAQRMSSILEKAYLYAGKTLDHQPGKISVILHPGSVISNGVVTWAPSRMELFTTPPQGIFAQDWLEQLAIHEVRHVVQLDKISSELPKIFKILLGEQAAAVVVAAYLPLWFLEGDAVATETALSQTGRGRLPSFEMELKAQVLEKGFYKYDKAYLGSYRDYVPDHYQLGYQMAAGIREKYGSDIWSKVLTQVARKPLSFNSFSKALRVNTGKNQAGLYNEIFSGLKSTWTQSDREPDKSNYKKVSPDVQDYTSYRYPYFVDDSTIFSVKYSIDDLNRFVLVSTDRKEKKVFTPGNISEESVSFSDDKIFWIERKADKRWANREWSLLRVLNLKNDHLFEKVYKEKIFAPVLSSDKKYLTCVKVSEGNKYSILLLSPDNGKLIKEIPTPDNLFFITPSWAEQENELFAVVLGETGKSILRFNPFTQESTFLLPFTYNNLIRPVEKGGYLYFNSSQSGKDNIFAIDLSDKKLYQVTSSRFGTNDPQISGNGKKLVYCDYTENGFCLVSSNIVKESFILKDPAETFKYELADKIAAQEKGVIPDETDTKTHLSRSYSKVQHLFNFHSWAPFHVDAENEELRPGISILSQNLLSTTVTQLGYDYSTSQKAGKWFLKVDYTGLYPVIGMDLDYGKGKSRYYKVTNYQNQQGQIIRTDTTLVNFSYHELNINGDIKVPFNLSHGKMFRLVQPEFQIGYSKIELDPSVPQSIFHGSVIPMTYRLYANNYLGTGLRDLQPRFGQVVDLVYRHTPFGSINERNDYGSIWAGEGVLYFPGFIRHHGIKLYGGYQQKISATNSFSDLIEYPRGHRAILNNELTTFRMDYSFPLFYPDWSLGKLSYFKRISFKLFYDIGSASIPINHTQEYLNRSFSSTGAEMIIDCHFLRFIVPVSIGLRQSYLIENKSSNFEFLFSLNLNQFR